MKRGIVTAFILIAFFSIISVSVGPAGTINPLDLLTDYDLATRGILEYRLVRTLALIAIGASLGASGATMQQALRNPLVDPYIVGLSSGASLGVVTTLAVGLSHPIILHFAAFAGGLIGFSLVIATSALSGLTGYSLIVVGVAYSYIMSGLSILIMVLFPDKIPSVFLWLLGSAAYVERQLLFTSLPLAIAGITAMALASRSLEVLSLGDEYAEGLGVRVSRVRALAAIATTISVAPMVALAGPIGFIGLTAPWAARMVGASRFQQVLLGAILYGISITLAADVAARLIVAPRELPLTVVTSMIGAPLLVYLSTTRRWR
ncbi:MAG: iron ABC transporter permease [Desulfurococcales archaeon]|nr:iron ABC transporter permease [Desulfurococcales archaeon]